MKYKKEWSIKSFRSLFALQVTEMHYESTLLKTLKDTSRNRTDQQNKIEILEKKTKYLKEIDRMKS